mmetsp:Transcript_20938/g.42195  ORF Transcript_20938/g.42195 Transcript_20938/m.42195 type:complete len:217 (+) Transcript_20938:54-704(+)
MHSQPCVRVALSSLLENRSLGDPTCLNTLLPFYRSVIGHSCPQGAFSVERWCSFDCLLPNSLVVGRSIRLEEVKRLLLCRILDVGLVQESLYSQQNLLDTQGRLPPYILVQNTEAYGSRWIYIWVEQGWSELAFWRLCRVFRRKLHSDFVQPALPQSLFLSGNSAYPFKKILGSILFLIRPGIETVRMRLPPLPSFLGQALASERHCSLDERCTTA